MKKDLKRIMILEKKLITIPNGSTSATSWPLVL